MADPDAVRQVRERARDREVSIWNSADGMGEVYAQLYATDAQALDARLNALVATVCAGDPRSTDQRRADALGALAAGADRLACRCDNPDCAAEGRPVSAVVIHVVAEQASVKGHGQAPAALLGGDGLIPAELVAELAKTAGLQPIPVPTTTRRLFDEVSPNHLDVDGCGVGWSPVGADPPEGRMRSSAPASAALR